MNHRVWIGVVLFGCFGSWGGGAEVIELKVSKVALFSSGVGYFQCDAGVAGNASAELRFRTDQVNDILKSLVVQDLSGGTVGVVSYASRDPVERSLKSFGVDITGRPSLAQLLDQLRGEPVHIAGPREISGIIIGVEKQRTLLPEKNLLETDMLNILTDGGIQQLALGTLQGIQLTSEKVNGELRKALSTLASSHDADRKSVLIRFDGQGQRQVRASYLIEAPIWKTSYRLVLSSQEKPFLQGWAMVENATEEDWIDVRLSLVSGRPISFTMDLYTPLYVTRPKEELELYASLRPPSFEGGIAAPTDSATAMAIKKEKGGQRRNRVAPAPGSGFIRSEPEMDVAAAAMEDGGAIDIAASGVASVATAQEAGELFEYVINTPVSIPRRTSAMLPIVNQEIEAEKLSVFNQATHPKYPLNALLMNNNTALNLMQGPVTVFDGNTYAGDAKLPDLKPAEKRLVAYALDLAMEVIVEQKPCPDELVSLRIGKGVLWHKRKYSDERAYFVKNKADKDRTLILEQPHRGDWELVEPKELFERTQDHLRFKITVPKMQSITHRVRQERVAEQSLALVSCGLEDVRLFLRSRVISPAVKKAVEKIIEVRTDLDAIARKRQMAESELTTARNEQARVRENIKTLQAQTDPYNRQMKKFDDLETQMEHLSGQISDLRGDEDKKRTALESYLLNLDVE